MWKFKLHCGMMYQAVNSWKEMIRRAEMFSFMPFVFLQHRCLLPITSLLWNSNFRFQTSDFFLKLQPLSACYSITLHSLACDIYSHIFRIEPLPTFLSSKFYLTSTFTLLHHSWTYTHILETWQIWPPGLILLISDGLINYSWKNKWFFFFVFFLA